jgi:tryptophanyl-tRNA synthetase
MILANDIVKALEPFRQKRAELAAKPDYIKDVLADGAKRAKVIARQTLNEAKQRMGLL